MKLVYLFAVAVLFISSSFTGTAMAIDAVASFGNVIGDVHVIREARKIPGRTGLILNDQDVVVTLSRSRATVIFRDGSEIRLFQDTRFVIEKSEESSTGTRKFFNTFKLKVGSFWGKFIKGNQNTQISTPTATIGIKGTNVSFKQANGKLDISLSSGLINVQNEENSFDLSSGNQMLGITRIGSLGNKVSSLPYRINIAADNKKFVIPKPGRSGEIEFSIQMVDTVSGKNVDRSGMIYVTVEIDKIVFPERIILNSRGYARVKAKVNPFQTADYRNGQVVIVAVMDSEKAMDVASGSETLTYDVPKRATKTIRIDVNTGEVR